jgi:hypothetical protein
MLDRPLDQVSSEDLQRLVANGVSEGRSLEYKQALPGGTDSDRKEFLADVSSFANAVGGTLLYGIRERRENGRQTGIADAIDGIDAKAIDADILRFENMLRDGIAPRLAGVQFRAIAGFPKGPVLLIHIPKSWSGPHMVTYQQHSRFYSRNTNGKYALDVFELRTAFVASGSLSERAREFRTERLGRLIAGDTAVPLTETRLIAIHIIPHSSIAGGLEVDLRRIRSTEHDIHPFYSRRAAFTFNLDGLMMNTASRNGESSAFLQVFRNGTIETVNSSMLSGNAALHNTVPSRTFADHLFEFAEQALGLLRRAEVGPPVSMFVALQGVRSSVLGISERLSFYRDIHATAFDRDLLLLPDLLFHDLTVDIRVALKPLLDVLWQAAGISRCYDYDENGTWKPTI